MKRNADIGRLTKPSFLGTPTPTYNSRVGPGIILRARITTNRLSDEFTSELQRQLEGCRHCRQAVVDAVKRLDGPAAINAVTLPGLIGALF